jgi:sugar O-acyltransferase (sialic acid O-acetyltransferase NeuD family)
MKRLWVIGSGGHAKVVIDAARASGEFDVVGVLDDREGRWGETVLGVPVRGPASPETLHRLGVDLAVIAVGPNQARAEISRRFGVSPEWATVVHPAAILSRHVRLGEGTVVAAGTVVQPDSVVGRHAILNTCCSVDHDCRVGDFVHLAPGVRLAGDVRIGVGALLGIGSCVLPQKAVGAWSTVGAGGVVVDDIPDGVKAIGVPARYAREGTAQVPEKIGSGV